MNRLYFGDNLEWLSDRKEFPDASVDLVYLDPPFNSNADYNVLFRDPSGQDAPLQINLFAMAARESAREKQAEMLQVKTRQEKRSDMLMEKCPICTMPASIAEHKASGFRFHCLQCGDFGITAEADLMLKHSAIDPSRVGAVSGYIRRNRRLTITSNNLDALRQIKIPPVAEKAMDLLAAFAAQYPQPGSPFPDPVPPVSLTLKKLSLHSAHTTYPDGIVPAYASFLSWIGISSANNVEELNWLIHQFLAIRGLVEFTKKMEIVEGKAYPQLILTPAGWAEVERLKQVNAESAVGFVAMSFQPEFAELYDRGIMPGIIAAGYQPLRIDRTEHNNRIDDEIIAAIKRSRFLVADFTTQRGGIYFEAGYALGLGLRVIWLVREDQLKDVHFDNRQYNFIRWQAGEWEALQRALKNRIEATIGIGPATGSLRRRPAD